MSSSHDCYEDTIVSNVSQATIRTPDFAFSYSPTTGTFNETSKNTAPASGFDSLHSFGLSGLHNQLSPPFSIPRTPLFLSSQRSPTFGSPEFQSNFVSAYRSPSSGPVFKGLNESIGLGFANLKSESARLAKDEDGAPSSLDSEFRRTMKLAGSAPMDSGFSASRTPADFEMLDEQSDSHRASGGFPPYGLSFATPMPLQPGFVADINMFVKEEKNEDIFVRPQDLLGELPQRPCGDESPSKLSAVESANPSPIVIHPPSDEHSCHRDCLDQLPLLVEQYLQRFAQPLANAPPDDGFLATPAPPFEPGNASRLLLYSPISSEILAAVEGPRPNAMVTQERRKFADIKNTVRSHIDSKSESRLFKTHDNGTNLMHLCDMPIPEDITIDKAHEGVTGELVAQKTKYYMMMHPGSRLSEELLFTFAGRLSVSGEQIAGYRCYVEGCTKATKRKDHMGDHVRTHLGEKPYLCRVCGMGFIRNNDCLRHENNHKPEKRFICDCGAAFSRRDLYVRHQKTACSGPGGSGSQAPKRVNSKTARANRKRDSTPDGDDADDFDYEPGVSRMHC